MSNESRIMLASISEAHSKKDFEDLASKAVSLSDELAATKQQLKNEMNKSWELASALAEAEQVIRESQEQEPVAIGCAQASRGGKTPPVLWINKYPDDGQQLYSKPVIIPQSAEQLHIKELREALEDSVSVLRFADGDCYDQAQCQADDNRKVLAKQPDTRALEKALLEARIDELIYAAKQCGMVSERVEHYKAKLAELNKV